MTLSEPSEYPNHPTQEKRRNPGFDMPHRSAAVALMLLHAAHAQNSPGTCGFDRLMKAESILATCCESTKKNDW